MASRDPRLEECFFQGRRYTRNKRAKNRNKQRYFYSNEWDKVLKRGIYRTLHREIWKAAHGPIPKGCDIHHKDGDWDNNRIENLELLSASEHHRAHGVDPAFRKRMRRAAFAWYRKRPAKAITCANCGRRFRSKSTNPKYCKDIECRKEIARLEAKKRYKPIDKEQRMARI